MSDHTDNLPTIERDEQMQREYIPLPGGWELQTKGTGSTLRLLDKKSGERHPIPLPDFVIEFIERMGREVHAALSAPAPDTQVVPHGWKLAPEKPTPDMRAAGHAAWTQATAAALEDDPGPERDGPHANIAAAYRAMLSAAPQPAAAPAQAAEPVRAIDPDAVYEGMREIDPAWNARGRDREYAVAVALTVVNRMLSAAPQLAAAKPEGGE